MKKSERPQDTGNIIEIANLTLPELQVYTSLNEAQLLHYFEPEPAVSYTHLTLPTSGMV